MKRFFLILMCALLTVGGFAGCSEKKTPSDDHQQTTPTTKPVELSKDTVRTIGNLLEYEPGKYMFAWGGSTIQGGFYGTEIYVNLKSNSTNMGGDPCQYLQVRVDDEEPYVLKVEKQAKRYELASGLKDGLHRVELVKRTEPMVGKIYFDGFDYGTGKAGPLPVGNTRRIEVYGDSITAGYGNELDGTVESGFLPSKENACMTYGMLAAKALHADCTLLACSGMGLYQSIGGNKRKGKFFDDFGAYAPKGYGMPRKDWKPGKQPDVAVINLGTNDFTSEIRVEDYRAKYHEVMDEIRSYYPDTYVLCCVGTMHYLYESSVRRFVKERNEAGDKNVGFLKFSPINPEDEYGGAGHPSVKTHQVMAKELEAKIREVMKW